MMSNPPVIGEHVLPSTPAQEWANATSSSLRERTATPSNTSTPGPEFPGAFPPGSDSDKSAFDTANWHIPSQKDVKNAVINAGVAAKQYLPDALTSYFPPPASTSHTANTHLSSQGDVSSPRGNGQRTPSQYGMSAARTDEKLQREQISETVLLFQDSPSDTDSNEIDTSFLTPHTNQNARERSSLTTNTSTQALDGSQMSSPDTPAGSPYPAGLGSPATTTDEDVNRPYASGDAASVNSHRDPTTFKTDREQFHNEEVPAEYSEESKPPMVNTTPRTHPLAGAGAKWKGVPLEERYQRALDAHPDRQLNIGTAGDGASSPLNAEGRSEASGPGRPRPPDANVDSTTADTGHSPAIPAARKWAESAASNASTTNVLPAIGSRINNINSRTSGSSKGSTTNTETSPKSSFMDRIKGEVKVISGKLAHNEEKVEEGKRMLGKYA